MKTGAAARTAFLLAAALLLANSAAALSQEDFNFMPKGGKALLLELFPNPAELSEIGAAQRSEAEWRTFIADRAASIAARDANELAAYLAINTPLPQSALAKVGSPGGAVAAFPTDGRELAWYQCQSCHSLFSGYLMHSRDVQGWRSIFLSPFHRGMKMTERERETFARYSANSMPMKAEDVPGDLRF